MAAEHKRVLLLVDEAQNLTPRAVEELRMLSNFQTNERSLLQSFLLGQPEFRQIMQQPEMRQLRQRVIASYHLGPLGPEETKAYIEHRLGLVGWQNDPSFDDAAFAAIHEAAGGIPRQINVLCDRILLAAFLGEKHNLEESDVADVAEELRTELRGGLSDEEAEAASQGFANSGAGAMPAYMPTLSMVNGKASFGTSRLSRDANGVLLNGLAEQVHLLQQSVASVARTLDHLRASEQNAAQPESPAEELPDVPTGKRPAQAGGMES